MGKRYTVMVVPERSSRVRRFRVAKATVWSLSTLVLVLIGAVTASTIHYFHVEDQLRENLRLRQENVELKHSLVSVHKKVASIESKLDTIQRFDTKLRVITELHDPKRHLALGPYDVRAGEGVSENASGVDPMARTIGEQPRQAVELLAENLDKLASEAEKSENSVRQLENYLRGERARLNSVPSIWPARGWPTSGFGSRVDPYTGKLTMHSGLDIANQPGVPVVAPARGVVTFCGASGTGYGRVVVIDHGYGVRTRFGHLSESSVRVGDHVERGDGIGKIGNSGRSTGPHLHYEVEVNGVCEDPMNYILEE